MAGPWEAYAAAAPEADTKGPWSQYQAPEFTRTLNQVVDDPARAAPMSAQAGASLRTRTPEQIRVYSEAMGIPTDRFGTVDGQIVYRDDQGALVRVSPSVTGARSLSELPARLGGFFARNAGEAIPAATSTGAAILGTSGFGIPVAGALGAAGETLRQGLGDAIYGPRAQGFDAGNIALQGGLAAGGQAAGLGLGRLLERNPIGATSRADRAFFRDPARVQQAQTLADDATRENVTLMSGDVTGRQGLLARDRQLGRFADTTDDMGDVVRRRNAVEVPGAVDRRIGLATGSVPSVEAGRAQFHDGARNVIDTAFTQMQGMNNPAFRAAFDANPGPITTPALEEVARRPAVAQAVREALTAAANSGRALPQGAPAGLDLEGWQLVKRSLDRIVTGGSDPITGAIRLPGGRDVREARDALRAALIDATGGADSLYGKALAESAPRLQAFADLEASGIGRAANRTGQGAANEGLAVVFDGARMAPERVALYRQAFVDQGQEGAWRAGFSAYLRDALEAAQKPTQRGEPANVAGKFYQQVFGTPRKQEAVAAALGGRNSPEFQGFEQTMRVLQAAARSFPEGSPTATDTGARDAFAGPVAQAVAGTVRSTNPLRWPDRIGDMIAEWSAGGNARRISQGYLAGPANNAAVLNETRLLPNAVSGLLLPEGGQLGAYGAAGLLGQPPDTLPPARQYLRTPQ